MPLTLLHLGVLAPINHFAPGKVSNVSFIVVNLWIDLNAILYVLWDIGGITHGTEHSLIGVTFSATTVAMLGVRSIKWVLGAYLGGISHALLDALVHAELPLIYPYEGNPLYMGWMQPLSLVLLPFMIWLIAQYVSYSRGWIETRREVA